MAGRKTRWAVAAALLAQCVLVVTLKIAGGQLDELLWISHVSLFLTTAGIALRRPGLCGVAFVLIAVPHTLWLVDFLRSMSPGGSPIRLAGYLEGASVLIWLGTAHHFYLVPLLAWEVVRGRPRAVVCLWRAAALFAALVLASRAFGDPFSNTNWAFAVFPTLDHPWVHRVNALPAGWFFCAVFGTMCALSMVPSACVLGRIVRRGDAGTGTPVAPTSGRGVRRVLSAERAPTPSEGL